MGGPVTCAPCAMPSSAPSYSVRRRCSSRATSHSRRRDSRRWASPRQMPCPRLLPRKLPRSMPWKKKRSCAPSRHMAGISAAPPRRLDSHAHRSTGACKSMASSPFRAGVLVRAAALFLTIGAVAWMIANTQWYVTITLFTAMGVYETVALIRFASQSSREIARFLDALSVDDLSQSFGGLVADGAHHELGTAMERVLARLRASRSERDEQAQYLQTLVNHVPVALLSIDGHGEVKLLNMAARRLFESSLTRSSQLSRYGQAFAVSMEALLPGSTAILRMERASGTLLLKGAATEIAARGARWRLVSLQNIENEMSAQELEAW